MFLDLGLPQFSANQAVTVTAVSQNVMDTASLGVGLPVLNKFGNATNFGQDIGIGDGVSPPVLLAIVGTTFTAGGAATLRVQLQAAPDTNNSGTPGTWQTLVQTDDIPVATLVSGTKIAEFTIPAKYPGTTAFPRFYRLNYLVSTGPFTAGTIASASIVTGRDDEPAYPAAY